MVTMFNISSEEYDSIIWRYMDFSKFINLLERSQIYLPKIDLFEDKFEGIHNSLEENDFFDITDAGIIVRVSPTDDPTILNNSERLKQFLFNYNYNLRNSIGVSCWRISPHESHAMWKIFLSSLEGVAIKTSISSLCNSIKIENDLQQAKLGKVQYIDYATEKIPIENMFNPFFYKNIYFSHEQELRLISYNETRTAQHNNNLGPLTPLDSNGLSLNLDYHNLIHEIVVSPYAPDWFYELVYEVCKNRYNINVPISKSGIELKGPN